MGHDRAVSEPRKALSIWWWAFGYFAAYVPYTILTKLITSSKGLVETGDGPVGSFEILPPSVMASVVTMVIFLVATGWWRQAGRRRVLGLDLPVPGLVPFLSALCSAGIIATTTLAYSFSGVSIVLVALLMRGGVLVIAPMIDLLTRRHVRWFSWVALALSLASLLVSFFSSNGDGRLPILCVVDVLCYLGCYFTRLTLMSHKAKSHDPATNLRYFVEEGMVSALALLVALAVAALVAGGTMGADLRAGFTTFFDRPVWLHGILVGVFSQGTGICGGLIFLDQRENTFCVPVNRASSVLAVVVASLVLAFWFSTAYPHNSEWYGAALILIAIGFLTIPSALAKRRLAQAAVAAALPRATAPPA